MGDTKIVKPSELDIYYQPEEDVRYITVQREPVFLYDAVSSARKRVTKAFSGVLTTHEKISNLKTYCESKFLDLYSAGLNDPYSLLVPSSIALATVTGAVVAGKGRRRVRRTVYAAIFGGTAAAVTHPERALDILETSYYHSIGGLQNLYYSWKSEETITEKIEKENDLSVVEDEGLRTQSIQSENSVNADPANNLENFTEPATKAEDTLVCDALKEKSEVIVKDDVSNREILKTDLNVGSEIIEDTNGTEQPTEEPKEMLIIPEQNISKNEDEFSTSIIEESKVSDVLDEETNVIIESEVKSIENEKTDLSDNNKISEITESNEQGKPQQEEMLIISEQFISKNKDKTTEVSSTNEIQVIEKNDTEKKAEEDLGQSDPSDSDMYSTRK